MVIAYLPLLIAIIGLLMYALCASAKLVEIGRILFWTGALVTLFRLESKTVRLF